MFEKIYYENHLGERVYFGENGVYINENDLRDHTWSYTVSGNAITGFERSQRERKIEVVFFGSTQEERDRKRNAFFATVEKDVVANIPGKIWSGDYFVQLYIYQMASTKYMRYRRHEMIVNAGVVYVDPVWRKELTYHITPAQEDSQKDTWPIAWSRRWAMPRSAARIMIDHYDSSDFTLTAFGPASALSISINGHKYEVAHSIPDGGYMVVDSRQTDEYSIYVVDSYGNKTNCFNDRSTEFDVFKKIPSGAIAVDNKELTMDLTIYVSRSEPLWI